MKNQYFIFLLLMISTMTFSQNPESSTRKLINNAKFTRINRDWRTLAEFKSGIGETVQFFPIEVINLKSEEKTKALQIDINTDVYKTAWIGIEEINEFITFIEQYVIPNLEAKYNNSSAEYIFNAKEMTLSYLIHEKTRKLTIKLNRYEDNYTFWTVTQVDKISGLLDVLKIIK
ncbi:hypothetical protein [Flavobacterium sp.]|uniref:hypothetical protein n=1 Tax=Flavobacterium sp. TaxID=239 RepID=UPI0035B0DD2B